VKAICRVSLKPPGHFRVFTAYAVHKPAQTEYTLVNIQIPTLT